MGNTQYNYTAQLGRELRDEQVPEFVRPFYTLMDDAIEQFFTELEDNKVSNSISTEKINEWLEDIDSVTSTKGYLLYVYYDDRIISNDALKLMETKGFSTWKHGDGVTAILANTSMMAMNIIQHGFYLYTDISQ